MLRIRRFLQNNRGQAIVEFAILLPVLFLILGGIIDYGRVFNETLIVTAAAREGARTVAVGGNGVTAAKTSAAAINRGALAVSVTPAAPTAGQTVTVIVSNPVPILTPLMTVFFPANPFIVRGTAVMRVE